MILLNDKIIKRFRWIYWWCYWNSKTWNKKEDGFLGALLAPLVASLVQPVISSVVKRISGTKIRKTGRGYMNKIFLVPFHPISNIEITKYFNCEPRFNGFFFKK